MLEATGVGHKYSGGDWLFRALDLRVEPGRVVSVLGPNARGKTTLLTCLAGIRTPREGSVRSEGGIGYVPQTLGTSHAFTVHEMVVMGRASRLRAWSTPTRADAESAWQALDRVGMADVGAKSYAELSGGQRQLVLMARALVCKPSVIVLDEPTSALDLRNQTRVLTVIAELAQDAMGVLFTTHDPTHALHVSHQTLLMDKEIEYGETSELLTAKLLTQLYRTPVLTTKVAFTSGVRTVVVPDLLPTGAP